MKALLLTIALLISVNVFAGSFDDGPYNGTEPAINTDSNAGPSILDSLYGDEGQTTTTPPPTTTPVSCPTNVVYIDRVIYRERKVHSKYLEDGYLMVPVVSLHGTPIVSDLVLKYMGNGEFKMIAVEEYENTN